MGDYTSHRGVTCIVNLIYGHILWYVPIYWPGCSRMRSVLNSMEVSCLSLVQKHPMAGIVGVRLLSGLMGPWFPSYHMLIQGVT